jgi:hypothetical protein
MRKNTAVICGGNVNAQHVVKTKNFHANFFLCFPYRRCLWGLTGFQFATGELPTLPLCTLQHKEFPITVKDHAGKIDARHW